MHSLHPELTRAMSEMLDGLDEMLRGCRLEDGAVKMHLAGGMAVHYYCGTRYTEDVDATFSRRLMLPYKKLSVDYLREDGKPASIYLNPNYNDTFAVMHPDCQEDAVEWEGIGNERRAVKLFVLAPVDLAVSKIARFSPQDRDDIASLGRAGLVTADALRTRATEALDYYVGDTIWIKRNLDDACASLQ